MIRQRLALAVFLAALCPLPAVSQQEQVIPGIEVFLRGTFEVARGKRLGLITNQTGRDTRGRSSIDLIFERRDWNLVALFSPEHGIRGTAAPGEKLADGQDEKTGLPIHSLYGKTMKPTPDMLASVDVLVFDIQDVGSRYYTYAWTMALAMQAAAERGIAFVVLDRPNPVDGVHVQGNVLDPAFASMVGLYPVPVRHGLTVGELARWINSEFSLGANLTVVPLEGWKRGMRFDSTGLQWIPPSPNMPSAASALHYPGICLFEATNLSVGRGTALAFQVIGAPWLDGEALARQLNDYGLPGVRFEAVTFTPRGASDGMYNDQTVRGVKFVETDAATYDPVRAGVAAMIEARRLHPDAFAVTAPAHLDHLAGTARVRNGIVSGAPLAEVTATWASESAKFDRQRSRYLLYQ